MSSTFVLRNCAAFYSVPCLGLGRRLSRNVCELRRFGIPTSISRSLSRRRSGNDVRVNAQMGTRSEEATAAEFFASVMPKEEIGAVRFLKEHPEYDGREVVIAVFDTGVDPDVDTERLFLGTKGLQITTDGRPKIVDVIDCTGDGDVDTSEIVKADDDGFITGVNGKRMKLNPSWTNPSGDWRIGCKSAYQLIPGGLKKIMKAKRLEKFQETQREHLTIANMALAELNKNHPKCTNEQDQKEKNELDNRVQMLHSMMTNYNDPGPMIDCVVWHDGSHWRAALDTSDFYDEKEAKGKLEDCIPMTDFHLEHQYGTLNESDPCNYAINVYDDGNVLSIVADSGTHGTHVCGIAAAHHPESPEYNGVAPGARIVACKVGDTRVYTLETATSLVRAAAAAIRWKVDVVNLSFGECTAYSNHGRVLEVFNDMVFKHGVLFVTSAGNAGPALSSVSAPGCCDAGIVFGAYVSPAMSAAAHSMMQGLQDGRQYTFSSRGPAINGRMGVGFSSPGKTYGSEKSGYEIGGAISNVPHWRGTARELYNGTSMASPNGCGGIALMVSGLKQSSGLVSRSRIVRAIENTSILPSVNEYDCPPEMVYGRGLIQIDKAFEYLEKSKDVDVPDIRFNVEVARSDDQDARVFNFAKTWHPAHRQRSSGICIREPQDLGRKHSYTCYVTAILPEVSFFIFWSSRWSTEDWVQCPDALLLSGSGRAFEINVDGTHLASDVNYAEVQGIDRSAPWRGPLFRVPITAFKQRSDDVSALDFDWGTLQFKEGKEIRKFVSVPWGANWAELTISAGDFEGRRIFYGDASLFLPDTRFDDHHSDIPLILTGGETRTKTFAVVGGRMMEICIAQDWQSLGESSLSMKLEFHGVFVRQGDHLTLDGSAGNLKIQAELQGRDLDLVVSVVQIPLTPVESTLIPLNTSRDTLPDGRVIHKLTLTYKLKLQEGSKITPRLPLFNRQMYDCEVEGQMVQIFDCNKKLLLFSECYPASVSVKKGDYTIIAVIRHDNTQVLKQFERMPLIVEKALEKNVSIPVYKTHLASVRGDDKIKAYRLYEGQYSTMVIGPLMEALPKDCLPGYVMVGHVTMGKCHHTSEAAPTGFSMKYVIPPTKPGNSNDAIVEELPMPAKLSNAARNAKIKALEELNLSNDELLQEFDEAVEQLRTDYPGHLPLLTTVLKKYDALDETKRSKKEGDILRLCEEIVSCIDKIELAIFLARKCQDESKEGKKRSKEATEEKEALILALDKQLSTTLRQQQSNEAVDYEVLRPIFEELKKWADPKESNLALMHARLEAASGRHAEAIKSLDGLIASDKAPAPKEAFEFRIDCMKALGWHHWARYEQLHLSINFPKKLTLF